MNNYLKLFVTLLVILSIVSCQKYKYEDEDLYRIYDVHKYYADGYDSTFYFDQFKSSTMGFTENTNNLNMGGFGLDTNQVFNIAITAYWRFVNKNESINIEVSRADVGGQYWIQYGPLALGSENVWNIINLDQNEFVLYTNYGNRSYKLILNRQ